MNGGQSSSHSRQALAIIALFGAARIAFMATLGLGRDEAYTLVVSRRLALSYFDHPPLHQWLAHVSASALGEGVWARLPFVAVFAAASWQMFALTRRFYGAQAGLAALIALNVTPFFFASAGAWIVPDGPLLLALATAAVAAERLFFETPGDRNAWRRWLAVGLAFGLAGLSKYIAALNALGFLAFLVSDRSRRRWLLHPAPYAAALLALALVSPVFVWNAEHGWASFRFQGGRAAPGEGGGALALAEIALGQVAYLSPWVFAALIAAALAGLRASARGDARARFLLCLAAPPILVFTAAPLWSGSGLPHWTMPGWFFLYPMLGAWAIRRGYGRGAAVASTLAILALAVLVTAQSRLGLAERIAGRPLSDPTLESLDWGALRDAPALSPRPAFVVTTKWWEAGKAGVALGPDVPIFTFSDDPRGIAFLGRSADFVGRDGVIIAEARRLPEIEERLRGYFGRVESPQFLGLRRGGPEEEGLVLAPAHDLTRAFPMPYPLASP